MEKGYNNKNYKNKGKKGQCSNERAITVNSNVGKIAEKIIKNRIEGKIHITQMQGGGKNIGTVDHLMLINMAIQKKKRNNDGFFIVFLDVEKTYDKAWLNGILDVLYRNGLNDRNWCYFKFSSRVPSKLEEESHFWSSKFVFVVIRGQP